MTCMLTGVASGVVYDVLYTVRCVLCGVNKGAYTVKDRIFLIICDLLYCLIFAAAFIFTSVIFGYGRLRLYMLAGCAAGAFVYLKSFHILVAFFVNKVYNRIVKSKELKNDGR